MAGAAARGIGDEARVRLLERVKEKLGFVGACRELGISKPSMSRYLRGLRPVPDGVVETCLRVLGEDEVREALSAPDRLRAMGVVREDGSIDYSLALEVMALASRDEYLKDAMLRFVAREFGEDLRRMLGVSFSGMRMEWSEDFERFLAEGKRRRKVATEGTMDYYRSLFRKHLEGKELTEELVDYVAKHENGWLRNVFRHYVQYLYRRRAIGPEALGWILEVVPSRSYRMDVRPYQVEMADVSRTLEHLGGNHEVYYAVYRLMLESGARVLHALRLLEDWRPDERVEVPGIDMVTTRLVVREDGGFARYYVGLGETTKRCEWVYMSLETLDLLRRVAGRRAAPMSIFSYAKRHGLVR
ncbi:MAG: integrase, partial [Conexivisphaera sp.]